MADALDAAATIPAATVLANMNVVNANITGERMNTSRINFYCLVFTCDSYVLDTSSGTFFKYRHLKDNEEKWYAHCQSGKKQVSKIIDISIGAFEGEIDAEKKDE